MQGFDSDSEGIQTSSKFDDNDNSGLIDDD